MELKSRLGLKICFMSLYIFFMHIYISIHLHNNPPPSSLHPSRCSIDSCSSFHTCSSSSSSSTDVSRQSGYSQTRPLNQRPLLALGEIVSRLCFLHFHSRACVPDVGRPGRCNGVVKRVCECNVCADHLKCKCCYSGEADWTIKLQG